MAICVSAGGLIPSSNSLVVFRTPSTPTIWNFGPPAFWPAPKYRNVYASLKLYF